jgi:hypothetical protein
VARPSQRTAAHAGHDEFQEISPPPECAPVPQQKAALLAVPGQQPQQQQGAAAGAGAGEVRSVSPMLPSSPAQPMVRSIDGSRVTGLQRMLERQNVVRVLSCSLEQLCPVGAPLPGSPMFLSLFHTSALPGISISDYLERLAVYTASSEEAMVCACIHILRLAHHGRTEAIARAQAAQNNLPMPDRVPSHPRINSFSPEPFQVSCFNIHRLLLTALLCTTKYADDAYHNNKLFSSLGGIALRELNTLEVEFLALMDFRIGVPLEQFNELWSGVFNSPLRHSGPQCCKAAHPMGPSFVVEAEPGSQEAAAIDAQLAMGLFINDSVFIVDGDSQGTHATAFGTANHVKSNGATHFAHTQQQQKGLDQQSMNGPTSAGAPMQMDVQQELKQVAHAASNGSVPATAAPQAVRTDNGLSVVVSTTLSEDVAMGGQEQPQQHQSQTHYPQHLHNGMDKGFDGAEGYVRDDTRSYQSSVPGSSGGGGGGGGNSSSPVSSNCSSVALNHSNFSHADSRLLSSVTLASVTRHASTNSVHEDSVPYGYSPSSSLMTISSPSTGPQRRAFAYPHGKTSDPGPGINGGGGNTTRHVRNDSSRRGHVTHGSNGGSGSGSGSNSTNGVPLWTPSPVGVLVGGAGGADDTDGYDAHM